MNQDLLKKIEASSLRKEPINFSVGDTVKVHVKVVEGDKERIQVFAGIVIARRGSGVNESLRFVVTTEKELRESFRFILPVSTKL